MKKYQFAMIHSDIILNHICKMSFYFLKSQKNHVFKPILVII